MLQIKKIIMTHLRQDLGFDEAKAGMLLVNLADRIRPLSFDERAHAKREGWIAYTETIDKENGLFLIHLGDTAMKDDSFVVHEVDHALAVMKDLEGCAYLDPEENWIPTVWGLLTNKIRIKRMKERIEAIGKKDLVELETIAAKKIDLKEAKERFYRDDISVDDFVDQEREIERLKIHVLWHEYVRFYELGLRIGRE